MVSELGRRPMMGNNENSFGDEFDTEIGMLLRDRRRQEAYDREKELNMYRSGSAPPTVEGSLSAVGGLFNNNGFMSEEELRSDPAYLSYYYSNVNLNPRLPPPLLSKEDWRFSQRLQGGGTSAIGDRRKVNKNDNNGNGGRSSPFSMPSGFNNSKKAESENEQGSVEWGGDGLIGFPGLGLGSKKKSIAEMFQDDFSRVSPAPGHPSRSTSRNAFDGSGDNTIGSAEAELSHLHHELSSSKPLRSDEVPTSYSYAAALSRSTTPDPQHIARAPSPSLTPIGGGRGVNTSEKRSVSSPNPFNGVPSSHRTESAELVAALSGMNMSNGGQNNTKHHDFLKQSESPQFNMASTAQSVKVPYSVAVIGHSGGSDPQADLHKSAYSNSSYLKGRPTSGFNGGGGGVLSQYPHLDSPNSSFPSYGLSGHSVSPMSNHLGNYNLPPLFGNAAAASAMAVPGLDSRMLGGSNLSAANSEQTLSRMGNQFVDPMYLQYLTAEHAAQVAALNDPSLDRNYMGNSYVDLLQKAYLGNVLPQKSQYGVHPSSKSSGYYGNPAFGFGLSYPGSPLASSVIPPGSPVGPGSPMRHSDYNMRFPGRMRNIAGGVIGPYHSDNTENSLASLLLEEFKSNKTKCFELSEIAGHVVEFSADQYGSRFIQQKLETATTEEKNMVFQEIFPQALTLMTDVFGNYVIQKIFEYGMAYQRRELGSILFGHVLTLSLQMYGCRVIQKAIEVVDMDQKIKMVEELDGHIMRCVRDQNGNHVIQKCIECLREDHIQFIVSTFFGQVITLSTHPYGCRVMQRVLEHCSNQETQSKVMEEILGSVSMLAQDQYGNYVVQHVLEHGKPHERSTIIQELAGKIVQMSQQKFASNVVEKCLTFCNSSERQLLVNEMLGTTDENEPLQAMMKDQFANYVVQKVLETCSDQQRELIMSRIKVHLNALKKYTYGKHIVARVEKLVATGERRIAAQSLSPA
ncbi:hypothetical protein K7X08_020481 [Anisodus acutangulus]|uniref:PUM-HD domain-containing protein n=1 Tax=Anisodus acutangulus TaxID=402998 RepID=A0A9Q1RFE0_9SOLA|nr:hypothetical protein K7X08_020481 [Anisodus acutangulus]